MKHPLGYAAGLAGIFRFYRHLEHRFERARNIVYRLQHDVPAYFGPGSNRSGKSHPIQTVIKCHAYSAPYFVDLPYEAAQQR